MKFRFLIFHFTVLICSLTRASSSNIDSLKSLLNSSNPTFKSIVLVELCKNYIYTNQDSALKYGLLGVQAAEKIGHTTNQAYALNSLGILYKEKGDYLNALDSYIKAEKLFEEKNDLDGRTMTTINLGRIYELQNLFDKALSQYKLALSYCEKTKSKKNQALVLNHLGSFYYSTNDKDKALEYFALYLKSGQELNNSDQIMEGLNNIAVIYQELGQYEQALANFNQYLMYSRKNHDKHSQVIAYHNIALVYQDQKSIIKSISYLDSSIALATEIRDFEDLIEIYDSYTEIFTKANNYEKAFETFQLKAAAKDSLLKQTRDQQFIEMSTKYETDKKDAENKILKSESEKQRTINTAITIGLILVAALAFFVYRSYRVKQKANTLLSKQNTEIKQQKGIIEEKQKEILDSISYAKRLQEAILPPINHIQKHLPESFIYYKPKDIVAGDFYWMEHKNDLTFIAAADCTGHGVPGAMVSVVCSNALNRAVLEFNLNDPGQILDKTRDLVLETFAKSDADVKDGMDISLASINSKTLEVQWAGAYNPLWYTHKGTMHEVTANKQSIGKTDNPLPFTTHSVRLNKGDSLFLFTDGFADQFGGPKGKKYKYKQLQNLLLESSSLKSNAQLDAIHSAFLKWKGDIEQVDDVCVVGIKI